MLKVTFQSRLFEGLVVFLFRFKSKIVNSCHHWVYAGILQNPAGMHRSLAAKSRRKTTFKLFTTQWWTVPHIMKHIYIPDWLVNLDYQLEVVAYIIPYSCCMLTLLSSKGITNHDSFVTMVAMVLAYGLSIRWCPANIAPPHHNHKNIYILCMYYVYVLCISIYLYIYMYIYIHVCTNVYIYIYTCIPT